MKDINWELSRNFNRTWKLPQRLTWVIRVIYSDKCALHVNKVNVAEYRGIPVLSFLMPIKGMLNDRPTPFPEPDIAGLSN